MADMPDFEHILNFRDVGATVNAFLGKKYDSLDDHASLVKLLNCLSDSYGKACFTDLHDLVSLLQSLAIDDCRHVLT
jgi:hypothetical protein